MCGVRCAVAEGCFKDKSKFSRFIHLTGMHLMGVHLMGVHLMGVHLPGRPSYGRVPHEMHLISLCLIPLGGKCDLPVDLWALTGGHLFLMGCSRKAPNYT